MAATTPANPCPKVTDPFCRLPLPTFFHSLEAAHLEDLLRLSVRPHPRKRLGFSRVVPDQGTGAKAPATRTAACFAAQRPSTPPQCLAAHENVRPCPVQRLRARPRRRPPGCGAGISTGFPFEAHSMKWCSTPRPPLGPPPQRPTPVPVEPFPTSVFKGPFESLLLPPRSALQSDPARSTADLALGPHALLLVLRRRTAGPRSSA
jgi:hypothetical protein